MRNLLTASVSKDFHIKHSQNRINKTKLMKITTTTTTEKKIDLKEEDEVAERKLVKDEEEEEEKLWHQ